MKRKVGLWIDHKKAVIFNLSEDGAEVKRFSAEMKNHGRLSGEAHECLPEEQLEKPFSEHLNNFYDEVISYIRTAESILIFGPGDAKKELMNRLEVEKLHGNIVGIETADTMTDNQIVTKVRERFLK
jgi:hypothetical protein